MEVIKIRKGFKVGELDAEADGDLLHSCFIDNGQIAALADTENHSSIVVGRTGAGKSAMLIMLGREVEHATNLDPSDISIRFLEHSNIISFFNELNIKIDLFYRVLWRHILTVELLRQKYDLRSEQESKGLLTRITAFVQKDKVKERALEYFRDWGDKFWLDTSEQLAELTEKLTRDVRSKLGSNFSGLELSAEGASRLQDEKRTQVIKLANQVVSGIQIQKLDEVLDLLAEHTFSDKQKRNYILIDKLDEDWAETETRCRFIRALIEETRALRRKLPQVKIVSALRRDLLDLVFERTRDGGFQEEKYEAYLLKLHWTKDELYRVMERRINEVYKRQYTGQSITFYDVFPKAEAQRGSDAADYIIDRTLLRPRDIIQFLNECFEQAYGQSSITWSDIRVSEAAYSIKRLKALKDEWFEFYPSLGSVIELIRGLRSPFSRGQLSKERLETIAIDVSSTHYDDDVTRMARELLNPESSLTISDFTFEVLSTLYHVSVVGLKISSLDPMRWSAYDQPTVTRGEVKRSNRVEVHRMFHRALEIESQEVLSINVEPNKKHSTISNRRRKRKLQTSVDENG